MPCFLSESESPEFTALPRKRCGIISTGKSLSSSSPNDESQRSSAESDGEDSPENASDDSPPPELEPRPPATKNT